MEEITHEIGKEYYKMVKNGDIKIERRYRAHAEEMNG
jgi:hypothetical protein